MRIKSLWIILNTCTMQRKKKRPLVASVQSAIFSVHKPRNESDCAKFDVQVTYSDTEGRTHEKTLDFGRRSEVLSPRHLLNDYPHHKNEKRKQEYLRRHSPPKEDWSLSGANTRGFYSRHMLWSEKTIPKIRKHLREVLRLSKLHLNPDVIRQLQEPYKPCLGSVRRKLK